MKLICINNEGCIVNGYYYNVKLEYEVNTMDDFELINNRLTLNKTYLAIESNYYEMYLIKKDDKGESRYYNKEHFMTIDEYRQDQLERIEL
jgi:hypothetical protein